MINFEKFPSLIQHYDAAKIAYWLNKAPGLAARNYVILEKLHGANIQLFFTPGKPTRVARRNGFLSFQEPFFDLWDALLHYVYNINRLKEYADKNDIAMILTGELFGGNVQDNVDYGPTQRIRFTALKTQYGHQSYKQLKWLLMETGNSNMLVKKYAIAESLQEALDFEVENLPSLYNGGQDAEGVVIRPLGLTPVSERGPFVIKKKATWITERPAKATAQVALPEEVQILKDIYLDYINDNRVNSAISKLGPYTELNQTGAFMGEIMKDVAADFINDYPVIAGFDKTTRKQIMNGAHKVRDLLFARL